MSTTRLRLAIPVAALMLVSACQPAPTGRPSPAGTPGVAATTPATTLPPFSPSASGAAVDSLADTLQAAVDPAAILADLQRLQDITNQHGGTRQAGSDAEEAAAAFVAGELREAGYEVTLDPVDVPYFGQRAPSVLQILADGAAPQFEDTRDFKAMLLSASGTVTAQVFRLGFDPLAPPGSRDGLGCNGADWAGVREGTIVLVQPGNCRRRDVVVNAQRAGVAALVTAYPEWERDRVLRPTLIDPDDIRIPAIGATHAVGLALAQAAEDGDEVRIDVQTTAETRTSMNVFGETPGGDPGRIVMLGGHLDSVVDGPGINDNGSGTMTILEIARQLATATNGNPAWKVRVVFWTGEELGLLGSAAYVQDADAPTSDEVAAYVNLDMTGSPNGVRLIYDGADSSRPTEGGIVAGLFATAFDRAGIVWQSTALGGSSDHFPFDQVGITTGGLFSGAGEHKSEAQAGLFGGTAGTPTDPCYHLACDTVDNVDPVLLEQMARAAAFVVGAIASGTVPI